MRGAWLFLLGLAACHPHQINVLPECMTDSADTVSIALPDSVDPPSIDAGRNESELLVSHQAKPLPGPTPVPCLVRISRTPGGVTVRRPGHPVLSFTWPGTDARDLLDGGFDAVLTGDPTAIEYATAQAGFSVMPLPWSRTYLIVVKTGGGITWAEGPSVWRDAMRGDARPTVPPFWWRETTCRDSVGPPVPPGGSQPPRMVYLQGDENARGLAERYVARGASLEPRERRERLTGVSAAELGMAVASGADYAVVSLPRNPADPCDALAAVGLVHRPAREVIPMLDTRLHLIVRQGRFGVSLDGDGIPLFAK